MVKKIIIYILFGLFGCIIILNKFSTKKIILDVSNRPDTVRSEINFIGDSITYAIIYRTVDPYNDSLFYVAYYNDSK
jgi:hypothetical protein